MSSEAKLVWRATALGVSAFTSGYFARIDVKKDYPFCHCGADMRGEQNEKND